MADQVAVTLDVLSSLISFIGGRILFFFWMESLYHHFKICLRLGIFVKTDAKLRISACSDVMSLDTAGDESIATRMVPASKDQCLYCHNSTEVIGVILEENLAPIYPSWILYCQVIQYPIDFPFCHFSTFCRQKCLLSYDPILFARNSELLLNLVW